VLKFSCRILEFFLEVGLGRVLPMTSWRVVIKCSTNYNNWRSVSTANYYGSVVFGQYNDMHMLYSNYMVLFALVDLQYQCMAKVSEPVIICIGKVLKKSWNWWMTKEGEPCASLSIKVKNIAATFPCDGDQPRFSLLVSQLHSRSEETCGLKQWRISGINSSDCHNSFFLLSHIPYDRIKLSFVRNLAACMLDWIMRVQVNQ